MDSRGWGNYGSLKQVQAFQEMYSLNKELAELKLAIDESAIIAITDQHGKILEVNRKFCELAKYRKEELIGQDHRIINSGYHPKEFFCDLWETIRAGKVWKGEIQNRTKDGSLYWVHTTIVPFLNEDNQPYRYFSIRIDITDQKKMESDLQKATQRQLEENQILYESLFKLSQDAVFTFNLEGHLLTMNPTAEKVLGYTHEELSEEISKMSLEEFIHKDDHAFTLQSFARALQGELQNFDTVIYNPNGQEVDFNFTLLPIIINQQKTGIYAVGKDISEQKRVQALNAYLAQHDELTNLLNRRGLEAALKQKLTSAAENQHQLVLMYIDLDRFKHVNDTLGHYIGDRLLEKVAKRLRDFVGEEDTIARMGGDEFMVLCPSDVQGQQVSPFAEALLNHLAEPFMIEGYELYVTASIGISSYPIDGDNFIDLMKHADVALYRAKDQGRNNYQLYSPSMDAMSYQSFLLERDLRKALNQEEFIVYLQPRVDVSQQKIIGAEALIRWNHPVLGLVSPGEFIPIAEETGLIIPIGSWMKRKVCELLVKWREAGLPLIPISINISPQRFLQADFAKSTKAILAEYGVEGTLLEIEITENSLMKNEESVKQTIGELKALGIKIYIDDFGTGYSSFSYLKSYNIDGIKIDQSFIRDISCGSDNAAITAAMIKMGQILEMEVIAEGVETEEELRFLGENQCHHIQGYLFGRPVPADEFERGLEEMLVGS